MSASDRMLGRWRTSGCQHHDNPGPDCAGNESDPRQRKRIEQRQTRREAEEGLREHRDRVNTTMDYGLTGRAEAPDPGRDTLTLAQKAAAITLTTAVIWAAGALILHAIDPQPHPAPGTVVWHDDTPLQSPGPARHPRR